MRSHYSIGEFAKRIGRSVQTVRRWEREGKLQAKRLPLGHRYFDESDVRLLLVAHKDRLMRFGFDLFAHLAEENGCEIVVVNQDSLSPEQELVEDLMAIVQTFSGRLSRMRKYRQTLKEDFADMPIHPPKERCE